MSFPPCPESLKAIAHYLKVADEHDQRDIVVSYWCRLHAFEIGMKISKEKTAEVTKMLVSLMDWLETTKSQQVNNEAITNKIVAQATVENYALKLFKYADEQDRAENYGKNVVKAFYTCGILMDVLTAFDEVSDDIAEKRKYAKWKAAYIHNCLKAGERPVPGPQVDPDNDDDDFQRVDNSEDNAMSFPTPPNDNNPGGSIPPAWNMFPSPPDAEAGPYIPPTAPYTPPVNPYTPPVNPYTPPPAQVVPTTPFVPSPSPAAQPAVVPMPNMPSTESVNLNAEQITKAQKYCKWASSALNYDDVKSAVENLNKALYLLQTGKESPE